MFKQEMHENTDIDKLMSNQHIADTANPGTRQKSVEPLSLCRTLLSDPTTEGSLPDLPINSNTGPSA